MKKLVRSKYKSLGGVCGGVADYFGWDVVRLRIVWVVLAFICLGSTVVFYVLLWILMPDSERMKSSYEERMRKRLGR